MDFLDIENYENLLICNKLNKEIQLLTIDINDFENKKKSNIHFLNIQKVFFNEIILKKTYILKKYNFKIIKNIINIYNLKQKNNEFSKQMNTNKIITNKYNKQLILFNIDNYAKMSNTIKKVLYKYNTIYNQSDFIIINPIHLLSDDDIIFKSKNLKNLYLCDNKFLNLLFDYICVYYLYKNIEYINNNLIKIYKYLILKQILNVEIKHYFKFKTNILKQTNKLININKKCLFNIEKNNKQINLIYKKTKDLKNKFNNTFKEIKTQEYNNLKLTSTMNSNIHELNIRIGIAKQKLYIVQIDIEKYEQQLSILNNTKGNVILTNDICSICLEDLNIGIATHCNHYFHYGCINLYIFNILQQNASNKTLEFKCPICRQFI
jgi:hypothetical protein